MPTRVTTKLKRLAIMLGFAGVLALAVLSNAPAARAACSPLPATNGTVTVTNVTVPAAGDYRVWARIISPSTGKSAVYLQVDSSYCNLSLGGGNSVTAGSLIWVNFQNGNLASKVTLAGLAAGAHQVTLAGQDVGVSVDKLLLLTDTGCTPTGDGANCQATATPTPSPGSTPSPTPTPIVIPDSPPPTPPVVDGVINLQSGANLTDTKYLVDGKTQDGSLVDTTLLNDGLHTIGISGIDSNGNTVTKQETIRVKNHFSLVDNLVHGLQRYGWLIVGLSLIAGIGVAAWLFRRSPLIAPLIGKLPSGLAKWPSQKHVVLPPPANVVYPTDTSAAPKPPEDK